MRIGETGRVGIAAGRLPAGGRRVDPAGAGAETGADGAEAKAWLPVPIEPPAEREPEALRLVRFSSYAPLVAQLFAHREHLPGTGRLRRATPARAAATYARAAETPNLLVPGYFVDVAR